MTNEAFNTKHAAIEAARAALGADAIPSVDFTVEKFFPVAGGKRFAWVWAAKTKGQTFAELVETAEVVDGLPNVALILATEDGDLGPVNAENARAVAQEEANSLGVPVSIRNELTDEVIEVVEPTPAPEGAEDVPDEEAEVWDARPASEVLGKIEDEAPAPEGQAVGAVEAPEGTVDAPKGEEVPKAPENAPAEESAPARDFTAEVVATHDRFEAAVRDAKAAYKAAMDAAKDQHKATLAEIYQAQQAAKPSRVVKAAETRARSTKVDGPSGKTAEVIELAKRPEGATVAELIALTGWEKAPWSWNFSNPKGTGWAQKFGYKFRSEKGEDRKVRYFLTAE